MVGAKPAAAGYVDAASWFHFIFISLPSLLPTLSTFLRHTLPALLLIRHNISRQRYALCCHKHTICHVYICRFTISSLIFFTPFFASAFIDLPPCRFLFSRMPHHATPLPYNSAQRFFDILHASMKILQARRAGFVCAVFRLLAIRLPLRLAIVFIYMFEALFADFDYFAAAP